MTSTETKAAEIAEFRANVQAKAEEYLNAGYGNVESWNRMLVTVGLTPIVRKHIRVKTEVPAVPVEHTVVVPAGYNADEFITRQGGVKNLLDAYGPWAKQWASVEPTFEVVDEAPGIDGVEKDANADTDDLDVYKRLVRREAIKLQREFSWCNGGTSDVLEQVGLPRIEDIYAYADIVVRKRIKVFAPEAYDQAEADQLLAEGKLDDSVKANLTARDKLISYGPADLGDLQYGDPDPTGWGDQGNNRARAERNGRCAHPVVVNGTTYGCTYGDKDHEGVHVAGSYNEVIGTAPRD
jgi:hypothetical protein